MTPDNCPNCGADVPANATACPECGSCDATGWSDAAPTGGLDLPDESFDYDEYIQAEFGSKKALPRGITPLWWAVSIVLVLALLGLLVRLLR